MLTSATTLTSRALRKRRPVLVVPVTVIAEAAAVLRAAELRKLSLILEVNALEPMAYDLRSFVGSLLMLARENDAVDVCICVHVAATSSGIEQALSAGAQLVRVSPRHMTPAEYESIVAEGSRLAAAHGAHVTFSIAGMASVADGARLARDHVAPFVTVPETFLYDGKKLSARLAADIRHALMSPIAMETDGKLSPTDIRAAAKAGLASLILTHETSQAFVAGLRAALANEGEQSASRVVSKAAGAVEERIDHYMEILCTM